MKILLLVFCLFLSLNLFPKTATYQATVSVDSSSDEILPSNAFRFSLQIDNDGTEDVRCKFGSVHASTEGARVKAGTTLIMQNTSTQSLWCESDSVPCNVNFTEISLIDE